jgi:histidine triad (HIT) family protein
MTSMTLFEKIISRAIPADIIAEEEDWIAIRDLAPQAPTHLLIIPKKPIPRIAQATAEDEIILGKLLLAAATIAKAENLSESGFRIVINNGKAGGESVPHLHLHLLGGRQMEWPPG